MVGKWTDDERKVKFIEQHEDDLTRLDENSAIFETKDLFTLVDFIDDLDTGFSDYHVVIDKRTGHPTIQVQLRLEAGLWKPK